jgi:biopolymer transport protein ExbB
MRRAAGLSRILALALIVACGVFPPIALAQEAQPVPTEEAIEAPAEQSGLSRAFEHYVTRGGWITLFVLVPLSVAALALIIQNCIALARVRVLPAPIVDQILALLREGAYGEAMELAAKDRSVMSAILVTGLRAAPSGFEAVENTMQEQLEEHAVRLHRKIEYLNLIGAVAPMLGLLGTVHGIIGMFVSISEAGGVPVMANISADLGQALVATFWGLLIAIPALAVFGWLRHRIDNLMTECASAAEQVLLIFNPAEQAAAPAERVPAPSAARTPAAAGV